MELKVIRLLELEPQIISLLNEDILLTVRLLVVKLVFKNVLVSLIVNVPDVLENCAPWCIVKLDNLELNVILLEWLVPKVASPNKIIFLLILRWLLIVKSFVVKLVSKNVSVSLIVNNPDVLENCVPWCIVKLDNLELNVMILLLLVLPKITSL